MSRIIIIPADNMVSIDGVAKTIADMSSIEATVHAVQWYGVWGEVEHSNPATLDMLANEHITDLTPFKAVLDAYAALGG